MKKLLIGAVLCIFSFYGEIVRPSSPPLTPPPSDSISASLFSNPTSAYVESPKPPMSSPTTPKPLEVLEKLVAVKFGQDQSPWKKNRGKNFKLQPCPKKYKASGF